MTDFASLSFAIDSSQALAAVQALEQMRQKSADVGNAARQFRQDMVQTVSGVDSYRASVDQTAKSIGALDGTLGAFLTRMDNSRRSMADGTAALDTYRQVLQQTAVVAAGFGQNLTGFEAYINKTRDLKIAAGDVGPGLERITAALANQSEEGRRTRDVMEAYGVTLRGLGIAQADQALAQFVQRIGQTRDSLVKLRDVQSVLGNISADTIQGLQNPNYIPFYARRDQQRSQQTNAQLDQQNLGNVTRQQQQGRDASELADLQSRFTTNNPFGGMFQTNDEQLRNLRQVATMSADQRSAAGYRRTLGATIDDAYQGTIGNTVRRFTSGQFGANQDEILGTGLTDDENKYGFFGGQARAIGNQFSNIFGGYQSRYIGDQRPQSEPERLAQLQQRGQAVADYGDDTLDQVNNVDRQQARLATPDAVDAFSAAYGPTEGAQRRGVARGRLQQQRQQALDPGTAQSDQLNQQTFLGNLSLDQRGTAQAYLQYAGETRTNVSGNLSSLDDLRSAFSPLQQAGVDSRQAQGASNRAQDQTQQTDQQIDFQSKLADALKQGKSAAEDFTRSESARLEVMQRSGNADEAAVAATNALNLARAQRMTQATAELKQAQDANDTLQRRNTLAAAVDTLSPAARQAALLGGQIDEDIRQSQSNGALANNPAASQATRQARQRQLSLQSTSDAADINTTARDQVTQNQQVLDLMTKQNMTQQQATAEIQRQVQFQKALSEAMASGDQAAIANVNEQIRLNAQLAQQQKQNASDQANVNAGQTSERDAAFNRTVAGAAPGNLPGQKGYYTRMRPLIEQQADANGPIGGSADFSASGNNPTNLAYRSDQPGVEGPRAPGSRFGAYASPEDGIAAGFRQMLMDMQSMTSKGQTFSIQSELNRRSPGNENDTAGMIATIAKELGISATAPLDLSNRDTARNFVSADIGVEQGGIGTPGGGRRPTSQAITAGVDMGFGYRKQDFGGAATTFRNSNTGSFATSADQDAVDASNAAQLSASGYMTTAQIAAERQRAALEAQGLTGAAGGVRVVDPNNPQLSSGQNSQAEQLRRAQLDTQFSTTMGQQGVQTADSFKLSQAADDAAVLKLTDDLKVQAAARASLLSPSRQAAYSTALTGGRVANEAVGLNQRNLQLTDSTRSATAQANAALGGPAAEAQATRDSSNATEERNIAALKARDTTNQYSKSIDELTQKLQANEKAEQALASAQQQGALNKMTLTTQNQVQVDQADASLSPFATDRQVFQAKTDVEAQQYASQQAPDVPDAASQYSSNKMQSYNAQEQAAQADKLRSSFQQAGGAIENAFNNAILNGGKLHDVMKSLTQELGNIALKAAEAPIEKLLSGGISNATSGLAGLLGLGGQAAAGASASSGASSAIASDILSTAARGGVYERGVRTFSGGGIVDRPTTFPMADGTGLMGEAGPEAVMPLERLPNGGLGVRSAGGSAGGSPINSTIHVHMANVNFGQGGGTDDDQKKALQAQVAGSTFGKAIEAHINDVVSKQFRDGGALKSQLPGARF